MMSNTKITLIILFIVFLHLWNSVRVESIPLHSQCPHQVNPDHPQSSSTWEQILYKSNYSPSKRSTHHLEHLQNIMSNLNGLINAHKDSYSKSLTGESFSEANDIEMNYDFLFKDGNDNNDVYLQTYTVFQKLQIVTEIILLDKIQDFENQKEYRHKYHQLLWKDINADITHILMNVYPEIMIHPNKPEPLPRSFIPHFIRCLHSSTDRNTRDFVFFRYIRNYTNNISKQMF